MARAKKPLSMNLGKVIKVEHGIAYTDKKEKSFAACEVGDVLELDTKTRKVSVKENKVLTPAQELKKLKDSASALGIEGFDEMKKEELEEAIVKAEEDNNV